MTHADNPTDNPVETPADNPADDTDPRGWRLLIEQPTDRRRRAFRFVLIFWLTFAVLGVVFLGGRAFAQCTVGGDTCPNPAVVQQKWDDGFYVHETGMQPGKAFNTPVKVHDLFRTKYVNLYKNASDARRKALMDHAAVLNNKASKLAGKRGVSKVSCQFPMTPQCAADLEWWNLDNFGDCVGWHSYPSSSYKWACSVMSNPGPNQNGLTWDQAFNGLKIAACTVASGAAIVMAVGTKGAGAPGFAAAATSVGCFTTLWEAVE